MKATSNQNASPWTVPGDFKSMKQIEWHMTKGSFSFCRRKDSGTWAEHVELKGDLNSVQVCLVGSLRRFGLEVFRDNIGIFQYLEVNHMSLGLGSADVDVKRVYLKKRKK